MQVRAHMHRVIAALVIGAALAVSPARALDTIRVSSEQWDHATHRDGSGLYWDIIRAVYEPAGIEVRERIVAASLLHSNSPATWAASSRY